MSRFTNAIIREIGRNTGKVISNIIFDDKHSTPIAIRRNKSNKKHKAAKGYLDSRSRGQRGSKQENKARNRKIKDEFDAYSDAIQQVHLECIDEINHEEIINQLDNVLFPPEKHKDEIRKKAETELNERIDELKKQLIKAKKENEDTKNIFSLGRRIALILALWIAGIFVMKYIGNVSIGVIIFIVLLGYTGYESFKIWFFTILEGAAKEVGTDFVKESSEKVDQLKNKIGKLNNKKEREEYLQIVYNDIQSLYEELQNKRRIADAIFKNQTDIYPKVLEEYKIFDDLKDYGIEHHADVINDQLVIDLFFNDDSIIPKTEKKLIYGGKELKDVPLSSVRQNEIYKRFVASSALRVAVDTFNLLHLPSVFVNCKRTISDNSTGHYQDETIISVKFEESIIRNLNLEKIDPFESLSNFQHLVNYKKRKGFQPIEEIVP